MDNPVAMINVGASETWYYYYTDNLGSVRLLTDGGGTIKESYAYDPYGQPYVMNAAGDGNWLTEDGTTYSSSHQNYGNPYMFTARRWDSATSLYYYRFRDYTPLLGRFVQTDPAGYIDTMNLYAYCGNNPVNWIDPWGLWPRGGGDVDLIDDLVRDNNLTKEGRRLLHRLISGQKLTPAQIADEAADIANLGGKYVKGGGATKSGWAKGGSAIAILGWILTISQEAGAGSCIYYDFPVDETGYAWEWVWVEGEGWVELYLPPEMQSPVGPPGPKES